MGNNNLCPSVGTVDELRQNHIRYIPLSPWEEDVLCPSGFTSPHLQGQICTQ